MKLIIDTTTGAIIASSSDDNYQPVDPAHITHPAPADFDFGIAVDWTYSAGVLTRDPSAALRRAQDLRIAQVKRSASEQIDALAWRMERARERDELGLPGESVNDVLLAREAIRRASNRVELEIMIAPDIDTVSSAAFAVTEADRTSSQVSSRLSFINRFTDAEMIGMVTAARASPAIEAFLLKWQVASNVSVSNPITQGGVQTLEVAGLIGPGRAAEILAVS